MMNFFGRVRVELRLRRFDDTHCENRVTPRSNCEMYVGKGLVEKNV